MEIQTWEYKTVRMLPESLVQDCEGMLNRIGGEGWELAFILPPSDRPDALVFKRPAQLPSDIVFTSDLKKTTEDNIPGGSA